MSNMIKETDNRAQLRPNQIIAELTEDERKVVVDGGTVPRQILLKLEALGLVMISPRHWWLTYFGNYIREMIMNKREMTTSEGEAFRAGFEEAKARALKAIEEEEELPSEPSFGTLREIEKNPVVAVRSAVITAKQSISERIKKMSI